MMRAQATEASFLLLFSTTDHAIDGYIGLKQQTSKWNGRLGKRGALKLRLQGFRDKILVLLLS